MIVRSILLATTLLAAAMPVSAQGLEAGTWQTMSPSSSIGPDQDSLLPPEVVPLDPNTANALSAGQAQSRQASMAATQSANVPGLAQQAPPNPMELRKQAFDQLLGGQATMPQDAHQQIWRAGQHAQQPQMNPQQPMAAGNFSAPGMSANMPNLGAAPAQLGAPNYQMANNQQMQQGYIAQSQTLTGSSQHQPQQVNTRRGGFSNMLNYAGAFGVGAFGFAGNPAASAGMLGMALSGFGSRNISRF